MTTPINVPVQFPGAQDSQAAMVALANAVAGLGEKVGQLGEAQSNETQKTQQNAQAHRDATQQQQAAATQAIAFAQRVAGVANAVQSLTSRLGSHDQTAGLIGSVVATTAQFAAMGAALGPAGVVGAAIAGFVISINELAAAHDAAATAATAHAEAERQLQQATSSAIEAAIRTGGDLSHADAHTLAVAAQARINEIAAIQEQITEIQESHAAGSVALAVGLTGAQDALALARGEGSPEHRIETLRQRIDALQREVQHIDEATPSGDGIPQVTGAHIGAGPGGPTEDDRTRLTGRGGNAEHHARTGPTDAEILAQQVEDAYAREAAAEQLVYEQTMRHTRETNEAIAEQSTERREAAKEREDEARREEASHRRYHEQLAHFNEQERRWQQEIQHRRDQMTQEEGGATQAIIGNLTNVFTLMAEGQANAAQGAELLLAGFLQYISQRATIEALAQVAAGIGAYPDYGGMALHFAAAAAWGAVAVATGVGGAALASDAQGQAAAAQAQQEKPANPQPQDSHEKGGSVTNIINWNSPVPMTQQEAARAVRPLRRALDQSASRYVSG